MEQPSTLNDNRFNTSVTIADLRPLGKEVVFIPVFINDDSFRPETFLKLVENLVYRFDKHAKNTRLFILVCDSLDAFNLLYSRGDIFKFTEQEISDKATMLQISKNRLDSTTSLSYEQLAHNMSNLEGQGWIFRCTPAIEILKRAFLDVTVHTWDLQKELLNNKCQELTSQLQPLLVTNSQVRADFNIETSVHFNKFIKRGLPLLMQKPNVINQKDFIIEMLNRYLFEKIIVFSSSIIHLQENNPDRNVVFIYPLPVTHRWHAAALRLLRAYLAPNVIYRLLTPPVHINVMSPEIDPNHDNIAHENLKGSGLMHAKRPYVSPTASPSGSPTKPAVVRPHSIAHALANFSLLPASPNPATQASSQIRKPKAQRNLNKVFSLQSVEQNDRQHAATEPTSPPQIIAPHAALFFDPVYLEAGKVFAEKIESGEIAPANDAELFFQFKASLAAPRSSADLRLPTSNDSDPGTTSDPERTGYSM